MNSFYIAVVIVPVWWYNCFKIISREREKPKTKNKHSSSLLPVTRQQAFNCNNRQAWQALAVGRLACRRISQPVHPVRYTLCLAYIRPLTLLTIKLLETLDVEEQRQISSPESVPHYASGGRCPPLHQAGNGCCCWLRWDQTSHCPGTRSPAGYETSAGKTRTEKRQAGR